MPDLEDGESTEIQGSAKEPYVIRNTGGVYACTCPAWRNQSIGIEQRTCKHIRKLRGDAAEKERVGSALPSKPVKTKSSGAEGEEADDAKGPPILLAHSWQNDVDLTDWWMSEKLDGVRAYWDGQQLISRQGNLIHAPDWFLTGLPTTQLDGELWMDRKAFQKTISVVRRQDKSDHWKQIKYLVFDAPGINEPFEHRVKFVADTVRKLKSKHVSAHEHVRCRGEEHLCEELARVESLGGEGLMLRQPESLYEAGRSTSLLKVKTFHDAEATVIDYLDGKGRHKGRVGSLLVRMPDGTEFNVGTGLSDKERSAPPPVGSTITYRYQELTDGGVPRFPSFVRLVTGPTASTAKPAASKPTKSTVKSSSTPAAPSAGASKRYFEYEDDKSAKFWEITLDGLSVTVRYGKIGASGQTQTKTFSDLAAATKHADKLIEEKTEKGYAENGGGEDEGDDEE